MLAFPVTPDLHNPPPGGKESSFSEGTRPASAEPDNLFFFPAEMLKPNGLVDLRGQTPLYKQWPEKEAEGTWGKTWPQTRDDKRTQRG